ncbi:MAG TPA: hypothetical protein DCZ91_26335 [Lachnospiraceae bacterium]|nr:hypothetical protein [Lachnospiraceae bacterium]
MKDALKRAVDILFHGMPFSYNNNEYKEEVLEAAVQKYDADRAEGMTEAEAAGNILVHFGNAEELCGYLGIEKTENQAQVVEESSFLKTWKRLQRNTYALAIELTGMIGSLLSVFVMGRIFSLESLAAAALDLLIFTVPFLFTVRKRKRLTEETDFFEAFYEGSCRGAVERKYDYYSKKLMNSLFLSLSLGFILLFAILLAVTTSKYTLQDVLHEITFYLLFIEAAVYLLLKNFLFQSMAARFFCVRHRTEYRLELRRLWGVSAVYYGICLCALYAVRNRMEHILRWAFAAAALYIGFCVFYNFTRRRQFVHRNITVNGRKITAYALAAVLLVTYNLMKMDLYLVQPYINTVSAVPHGQSDISYDEDTGVYTITTREEEFKILQLTDIHLGGSILSATKDMQALQACYRLISETHPDLVVVTGDLVFPMGIMSFSLSNNAPIMQFASFMRNTGIPWAFTYGNHDTESMATLNRGEVDELLKALSYKSSQNLLYPYVQPDIYGRSNQVIEVRASDGKLMQALFLIDSNDYVEAGGINAYDYIHDDQVEWYRRTVERLSRQEGEAVPSMIFTHIPLREYKEANDLYESGSDEVKYYYGILGETMIDKICCSEYDSRLFDTAVELGSTKAIFCGHDHYNNQSLEYKGIRLTYGYSIDYLAMPGIDKDTEQRGATLITIGQEGGFSIVPYRLTDLEDQEGPLPPEKSEAPR